MSLARPALLGATALYVALIATASARMPERVASHFGLSGAADAYSTRSGFLLSMAAVGIGLALLFLYLPPLLARFPGFINLPHRDFWLAPARRDASLRFIAAWLTWMGVVTLLLLSATLLFVVQANRTANAQLSPAFWLCLAAYAAISLAAVAWMWKRFEKPREAQGTRRSSNV